MLFLSLVWSIIPVVGSGLPLPFRLASRGDPLVFLYIHRPSGQRGYLVSRGIFFDPFLITGSYDNLVAKAWEII